jgi:hypothetical protein
MWWLLVRCRLPVDRRRVHRHTTRSRPIGVEDRTPASPIAAKRRPPSENRGSRYPPVSPARTTTWSWWRPGRTSQISPQIWQVDASHDTRSIRRSRTSPVASPQLDRAGAKASRRRTRQSRAAGRLPRDGHVPMLEARSKPGAVRTSPNPGYVRFVPYDRMGMATVRPHPPDLPVMAYSANICPGAMSISNQTVVFGSQMTPQRSEIAATKSNPYPSSVVAGAPRSGANPASASPTSELVRSSYSEVFDRVDVGEATRKDLKGTFIHVYQTGDTGRPVTCFRHSQGGPRRRAAPCGGDGARTNPRWPGPFDRGPAPWPVPTITARGLRANPDAPHNRPQ